MPAFNAIPLIVDQNAVRLEPFPASSTPEQAAAGNSNPHSGINPATSGGYGSPAVNDALADDNLSPEEVDTLQKAAAQGDAEAFDLLKQLGIPLGIAGAAILGGATIYGLSRLRQAGAARYQGTDTLPDGSPKFIGPNDLPPTQPGMRYGDRSQLPMVIPQVEGELVNGGPITPENNRAGQQALPAPTPQVTDQRATRFNQPAPAPQAQIPDTNRVPREIDAAYAEKARLEAEAARKAELEKNFGHAVGMRLRDAARAVRKLP